MSSKNNEEIIYQSIEMLKGMVDGIDSLEWKALVLLCIIILMVIAGFAFMIAFLLGSFMATMGALLGGFMWLGSKMEKMLGKVTDVLSKFSSNEERIIKTQDGIKDAVSHLTSNHKSHDEKFDLVIQKFFDKKDK